MSTPCAAQAHENVDVKHENFFKLNQLQGTQLREDLCEAMSWRGVSQLVGRHRDMLHGPAVPNSGQQKYARRRHVVGIETNQRMLGATPLDRVPQHESAEHIFAGLAPPKHQRGFGHAWTLATRNSRRGCSGSQDA